MAIYSPLRSRRLTAQQTEVTQRLIIFQLRQETFALQLDLVHKVIVLDPSGARSGQRLYGDPNRTGVSLTTYQGRELVVIDVGQQIFGTRASATEAKSSNTVTTPTNAKIEYLLILQPEPERLVGLPIDSAPSIQSIQLSAFKPLPDLYQQYSQIHSVSAMSIDLPDRPSIFLLDATALTQLPANRAIDN
jgi:chemotaxis signal transduction protein